MIDKINFKIKPKGKDVSYAFLHRTFTSLVFWAFIIFLLTVIYISNVLIGIEEIGCSKHKELLEIIMYASLIALITTIYAILSKASEIKRTPPEEFDEINYSIDYDGCGYKTNGIECYRKWKRFGSISETNKYFYIVEDTMTNSHIIYKDQLSEEEFDGVKEILTEIRSDKSKLGKYKFVIDKISKMKILAFILFILLILLILSTFDSFIPTSDSGNAQDSIKVPVSFFTQL